MNRLTALVAAFAVALGGGALVASVAAGDAEDTRVVPTASARERPVIGPDDGTLGAEAGGAGAGGGAGAAGGGVPRGDPTGVVQEYDDLDDGSGRPSVRFVDPCTERETTGACEGVASTVLSIVDAPPFDIVYGGAGCSVDTAGTDPVPLGWLVHIRTTAPGDFDLTLTDTDEPTNVHTAHASTSAAETAEWEASERGLPLGVWTCAAFDLPNATNQFRLTIEGRRGGETDTYTTLVSHEGEGGRPPVFVQTPHVPNEHRLRVVVPSKHGDDGGVRVMLRREREDLGDGGAHGFPGAEPVGGPYWGDACPRNLFDSPTSPSETRPIPRGVLEARDYPYDQGWDHVYDHTYTSPGDFGPGSRYELCIFWLDGEDRIIEKLVYPLISPNRYTVTVQLRSVSFGQERVPSNFHIETLGGRCRITPGGSEPVRQRTYESNREYDVSGCFFEHGLQVMPGTSFAAGSLDPVLRVSVTGPPREAVAFLHLPLSSCDRPAGSACGEYPHEYSHTTTTTSFTEDYTIGLGAASGGGLCGSSFGDCEPPRERFGTITLRIRFSETNRQGGRLWIVGPPAHIRRPGG